MTSAEPRVFNCVIQNGHEERNLLELRMLKRWSIKR